MHRSAHDRPFGLAERSLRRPLSSTRRAIMAAAPRFEAWVKDFLQEILRKAYSAIATHYCATGPFSHRALLTLEEKKARYERHYIDLANKPDWLFEINEKGSVPAIKDLEADKWITDSGEFVDYLEDQIPEPRLGKADDAPKAGSQLFPSFVKFLKGGAKEEQEMLNQFGALSRHLEENGPFLKGNSISSGDLALGPKLYHALTALKTFKNFDLPAEHRPVKEYLAMLQSRASWQNTKYSEDLVNAGWKAHLES